MPKPDSKKYLVTTDNAPTVIQSVIEMIQRGVCSGAVLVTLGREKRTNAQNAKQWPMLQDISDQVVHFERKYSKEDWKEILTAGLNSQRLVPGTDGGLVAIGGRTSEFSKEKFSEYIEFLYWWGQENSVNWSGKSVEIYEEYEAYAKAKENS